MLCNLCNGQVLWMGPLSNVTHTQCQACGEINCQKVFSCAHIEELEEMEALEEDFNDSGIMGTCVSKYR